MADDHPTTGADHLMSCDKGPVLELLIKGQEAIFTELKSINKVLVDVALQSRDISDLKQDVAQLKTASHSHKEKKAGPAQQVLIGVAIVVIGAMVLGALSFTGYIVVKNIGGYTKAQQTQYSGDVPLKEAP